jgi:hypothetical protein
LGYDISKLNGETVPPNYPLLDEDIFEPEIAFPPSVSEGHLVKPGRVDHEHQKFSNFLAMFLYLAGGAAVLLAIIILLVPNGLNNLTATLETIGANIGHLLNQIRQIFQKS